MLLAIQIWFSLFLGGLALALLGGLLSSHHKTALKGPLPHFRGRTA